MFRTASTAAITIKMWAIFTVSARGTCCEWGGDCPPEFPAALGPFGTYCATESHALCLDDFSWGRRLLTDDCVSTVSNTLRCVSSCGEGSQVWLYGICLGIAALLLLCVPLLFLGVRAQLRARAARRQTAQGDDLEGGANMNEGKQGRTTCVVRDIDLQAANSSPEDPQRVHRDGLESGADVQSGTTRIVG